MSVASSPWPRRVLLLGSALALLATSCAGVSTAEAPARARETADWVPFKGTARVGRTWGHPGGHAFPSVDFQVPAGQSIRVYAAGPGTVFASTSDCPDTTASGQHVGCNGGNGNLVDVIHPDGRRSRYLHLRQGSVTVEPGDHVCRGCPIGRSGWSGNVIPAGPAGAHLHYEELVGYTLVAPGPMLGQAISGGASYPGRGKSWIEAGESLPRLANRGFPVPAPPPVGACFGWAATIEGGPGSDTIRGTAGHDVIFAAGGDDTVIGTDGEDRVCGGPGDDSLTGGGHPDYVDGEEGTDTCYQGDVGGFEENAAGVVLACERPSYTLTVTTAGSVVTSQPAGISCPDDCSESYVTYTRVLLRASPAGVSWAGCDTSTAFMCNVAMSRDRTVRV